jgi:hypothetical protein
MPLPVEQDKASDPIDVGLLGPDAVVQPPDDVADLIEQPGLVPSRGQLLMSVHAVFPYGGARAPCTIPFVFKALPALPTPPPRYNTAPRWPPQSLTVPQPIPGPGRDEAGARCVTQRVLRLVSGLVAAL